MEEHCVRLTNLEQPSVLRHDLFEKFVVNSNEYKNPIAEAVKNAELTTTGMRFWVWGMFLGIIDIEASWEQKVEQRKKSRSEYADLWKKHMGTPVPGSTTEVPQKRNPLNLLMKTTASRSQVNAQQERRTQEEITKGLQSIEITVDTYTPERIRSTMNNVLLVWCKDNPDVDAKQWKFEILACVSYAYYAGCLDKKRDEKKFEGVTEQLRAKIESVSSDEFAEADIFAVFSRIMNKHKDMYSQEADLKKHNVNPNSRNNTPLLQRVSHIWDVILKAVDLELFRHMQLRQVNPRSFLCRWVRPLLFGQFGIAETLAVWDNIFLQFFIKKEGHFDHLDFLCAAMLIYLREITLNKESSLQIMQIYEKFPTVNGTYFQELISLSWTLRELYDEILTTGAGSPSLQPQPTDLHFISKEYLDQAIYEEPEEIPKPALEAQANRKSSTSEGPTKTVVPNQPPLASEKQVAIVQQSVPESSKTAKPPLKGDPLQLGMKLKTQSGGNKPQQQSSSRKTSVEDKVILSEKIVINEPGDDHRSVTMTVAQWNTVKTLLNYSIVDNPNQVSSDRCKEALIILQSLIPNKTQQPPANEPSKQQPASSKSEVLNTEEK